MYLKFPFSSSSLPSILANGPSKWCRQWCWIVSHSDVEHTLNLPQRHFSLLQSTNNDQHRRMLCCRGCGLFNSWQWSACFTLSVCVNLCVYLKVYIYIFRLRLCCVNVYSPQRTMCANQFQITYSCVFARGIFFWCLTFQIYLVDICFLVSAFFDVYFPLELRWLWL